MELDSHVALVTGGAVRLGRAIVLDLARRGADIALHFGRSAEQAERTADQARQTGRRVELFQADLTRPDDIAEMFGLISDAFGHLDVLVNNAGTYERTPIDELTGAQWDAAQAVNARAAALCIRHASALMTDGGAIVNITDIAAGKGWGGYPAYCASKAAMTALTKSCARALAGRNIRVNAVAPGAIIWDSTTNQEQQQRVLAQIPMKRTGTPADIASAVAFLAEQDYITAQTLRVDGGWHMG